MTSINLDQAHAHLPEIISGLNPGEELMIVAAGKPLATITKAPQKQWPCAAGTAKNTSHWMAADFNAPLKL